LNWPKNKYVSHASNIVIKYIVIDIIIAQFDSIVTTTATSPPAATPTSPPFDKRLQ
jgi:hypothetical protein